MLVIPRTLPDADARRPNRLVNLVETLPKAERSCYVFVGNPQVLDQILRGD